MTTTASEDYARLARAVRAEPLPCALVDLDAFDANVESTLRAMAGTSLTLRPATKSVRVPALLERVARLGGPRIRGLMTYSARETAWLADRGFDDLLLAYPVARAADARALAEAATRGARVTAVIDHPDHVGLLAAADDDGVSLGVCLEVDVSLQLFGGRVHLGARRSPIRDAEGALALARQAADAGLEVRGIMAYESLVAGMPDAHPGQRHLDPARRLLKRRSARLAAERRRAIAERLEGAGFSVAIVNGGGTGSLATTPQDGSCTEITVGSGFFDPHLFDRYRHLSMKPAAFFALGVVRHPAPGYVTCFSGGFIASGGAGPDRAPEVYLPEGLTPLSAEGFGEVQTPLRVRDGAPEPALGDPIFCRHAKAGELTERFNEVILVRGAEIVERIPTYRGLGLAFG